MGANWTPQCCAPGTGLGDSDRLSVQLGLAADTGPMPDVSVSSLKGFVFALSDLEAEL